MANGERRGPDFPTDPVLPPGLQPPAVDPDLTREVFRERELERNLNERLRDLAFLPPAAPQVVRDIVTTVPRPAAPVSTAPVIRGLGTIIPGAPAVISAAIVLADAARILQETKIEKELIEADIIAEFELKTRRLKEARDRELDTIEQPEIIFFPQSAEIEFPAPPEFPKNTPTAPEIFPEIFPEIPVPQPGRPTLPQTKPSIPIPEVPLPAPSPATLPRTPQPQTAPKAPTRKIPLPAPATFPLPTPGPLPAPGPVVFPSAPPLSIPIPQPLQVITRVGSRVANQVRTATEALTGLGTRVAPSTAIAPGTFTPTPFPQSSPPAQSGEKQCQEVKRRRRRKGLCREGFFTEFPGKTRYTTWRTVDCVSRKETKTSKLRRKAKTATERIIEQLRGS